MDVKYNALPEAERAIVYVRPVPVSELPAEVQEQVGDLVTVYSVNRPDGERVALVADRKLAFSLARQHEMVPVSVH
ncbi:DUF1150 family protein [Tabrizicola oligotrophica]|uniref:DUF1150 family protein n=1 Tax=Tabrizicola oligotrophica TaxID=2710650 RepID=A0A6M0QVQ3_9RHOB|nr:DUF1150 family protein [Tabrizicola oligotrophica]NEY90743.1 DUF1150 family protein [Tabrizicola oligotrophica]